jgi:hypothetical protein
MAKLLSLSGSVPNCKTLKVAPRKVEALPAQRGIERVSMVQLAR